MSGRFRAATSSSAADAALPTASDCAPIPWPRATVDSTRQTIALVPRLRHAHIIRTWTGIEGVMPDDIPVIGPSRTTPGLFHAFGFSGHGFQLGPAMGAVLERARSWTARRRRRSPPSISAVSRPSASNRVSARTSFASGQVENGGAQLLTALGADQILR